MEFCLEFMVGMNAGGVELSYYVRVFGDLLSAALNPVFSSSRVALSDICS